MNKMCSSCGAACGSAWAEVLDRVLCMACDTARRFKSYANTKCITTSLMLDAIMIAAELERGQTPRERDPEILALAVDINSSHRRIRAFVRLFEKEVWFRGLQPIVQNSVTHGLNAQNSIAAADGAEMKFLAYAICGRAMVTLETPACEITVITAEDSTEPRMGIQSICAIEAQAIMLLDTAIGAWVRGEIMMQSARSVHVV